MSSVYQINKGINKSIEFRGLKAQYIGYLAGGLVSLLVLFAILYITCVNMYTCLVIIFGLGTGLFITVSHLSHKYGASGLQKRNARSSIPTYLYFNSRKLFTQLKHKSFRQPAERV